ncbi:MAG: T9SS type A sorting domain-containing protein [Flavobacteriales bacterium]|nr:T9SS type A sorting domain-containing protein [Flavobacteriales bacterium]
MFAEDSRQAGENGNDMIWNPTATIINNLGQVTFGGKHFLYVMGPEYLGDPAPYQGPNAQDNPYYGALLNPTPVNKRGIFQNCTWTMIPTVANGRSFLETDVTIKLRVSKEYEDLEIDNSNGPHPMYEFETSDMATIVSDQNTAENALSIVRVVPNPYYAYSAYENTSFERRVKITNLPQRCVISIYSANGTLVKRFQKDNPRTFQEWNLLNESGRVVASGMYVVHVRAEGIGETTVKCFLALRADAPNSD